MYFCNFPIYYSNDHCGSCIRILNDHNCINKIRRSQCILCKYIDEYDDNFDVFSKNIHNYLSYHKYSINSHKRSRHLCKKKKAKEQLYCDVHKDLKVNTFKPIGGSGFKTVALLMLVNPPDAETIYQLHHRARLGIIGRRRIMYEHNGIFFSGTLNIKDTPKTSDVNIRQLLYLPRVIIFIILSFCKLTDIFTLWITMPEFRPILREITLVNNINKDSSFYHRLISQLLWNPIGSRRGCTHWAWKTKRCRYC